MCSSAISREETVLLPQHVVICTVFAKALLLDNPACRLVSHQRGSASRNELALAIVTQVHQGVP